MFIACHSKVRFVYEFLGINSNGMSNSANRIYNRTGGLEKSLLSADLVFKNERNFIRA